MAVRRVLVVDDNVDAASMMAMCLELQGHHVEIAVDGRTALVLAETFEPEVVLLELRLPDIDAPTLVARLRQLAGARRLWLIAVTAWNQAVGTMQPHAHELAARFVKPVDAEVILEFLAALDVGADTPDPK